MDIDNIIRDMNRHMPSSRRTLLEIMESGDLTYRTKDGMTICMEPSEIDALSSVCTEIEKMRLRVPIFVMTDISMDNAWKVEGTIETAVMSKILDRRPLRDDMMRFYHPDLRMLRSRFPNAISVLYLP